MTEHTILYTEGELRGFIGELDDLLEDYRQTQQVLDEQRAVLTDQVQGALAEYEKRVSDYEQQRDSLDSRQAEHNRSVNAALENRAALQMQLDYRLGKKPAGRDNPAKPQAAEVNPPKTMASKDQVEKLEAQLSKPKPELKLDPPGAADQTSKIDADLKQLAKEKRGQLNAASLKVRSEWKNGNGPKP